MEKGKRNKEKVKGKSDEQLEDFFTFSLLLFT
jgi:hypothetical protein